MGKKSNPNWTQNYFLINKRNITIKDEKYPKLGILGEKTV